MNGDDSQEGQAIVSKKSLKHAGGANHDYVQEIERSGNANNILGIIWLNVMSYNTGQLLKYLILSFSQHKCGMLRLQWVFLCGNYQFQFGFLRRI